MDERLRRLEEAVERLAARVERLERRLEAGVPEEVPRPAATEAPAQVPRRSGPTVGEVSTLLGRSCLILGGAFLLRALTEAGTFGPSTGMVVGLAYGFVWLVLAARAGATGRRLSAAFLGVTAEIIAFPLIWETAVRFHSLPPGAAAVVTAAVVSGALLVGGRFGLRVTAAGATLGGLATAFGLMVLTHAAAAFTAVLLLIGLETCVLAYATRWHVQRWPAALVADLAVFQLTVLAATPGGPPEPYADLRPAVAVALALALFIGYVALSAGRAAYRSRDLSWFETVQSALAFAIGLFGAVRVCRAVGGSCSWLAWLALCLAMAAYLVAFAHVDRREGRSRAFYFFLVEGLVLFVTATWLLAPIHLRLLLWTAAAVVAAMAAARWGRVALAGESAVLVVLVAGHGGGLAFAWAAVVGTVTSPPWTATFSALAPAVFYLLLDRFRPDRPGALARWPHALAASLGALGLLAAVVAGVAAVTGLRSPGAVAALATTAASAAAVGLTLAGASGRRPELGLLGSVALVGAGAKLLLVDLRVGTPATLVVSLLAFGFALLATARVRHRPQREG